MGVVSKHSILPLPATAAGGITEIGPYSAVFTFPFLNLNAFPFVSLEGARERFWAAPLWPAALQDARLASGEIRAAVCGAGGRR